MRSFLELYIGTQYDQSQSLQEDAEIVLNKAMNMTMNKKRGFFANLFRLTSSDNLLPHLLNNHIDQDEDLELDENRGPWIGLIIHGYNTNVSRSRYPFLMRNRLL